MSKKTIEEAVVETFNAVQVQVLTAQELLNEINSYKSYGRQRLDSLSSKLKRLVDQKVLLRVKGYGPRGGYGYLLNPNGPEERVLRERDWTTRGI